MDIREACKLYWNTRLGNSSLTDLLSTALPGWQYNIFSDTVPEGTPFDRVVFEEIPFGNNVDRLQGTPYSIKMLYQIVGQTDTEDERNLENITGAINALAPQITPIDWQGYTLTCEWYATVPIISSQLGGKEFKQGGSRYLIDLRPSIGS